MAFRKWVIGCFLCLLSFAGCTLDHSSPDVGVDEQGDNYISGVVIAGGPVQGTISLKNAPNELSTTVNIAPDGTFTIILADYWTGPYMLQVNGTVGGRSICLHSLGTRADVTAMVNVTPLTNLIAGNLIGKNPEIYYDDFSSPKMSIVVTEENLAYHEELVRSRFASMLERAGVDIENYNLLTTPIEDNVRHTQIDALFDFLRITSNRDEEGHLLDSMSITNLLTDEDPIIDDLTDPLDNDPLTPLPDDFEMASQHMVDIVNVFQLWEDLFADGLPDPENETLKSIFMDDFLYNGYVRDSIEDGQAGFLETICVDSLEDMVITGVALDSINLGSEGVPATATVSFTITNGENRCQSFYNWQLERTVTGWKTKGNQQKLSIYAGTYLGYSLTTRELLSLEGTINANGLLFYAYAPVPGTSDDVDYIDVTGPGISEPLRLDKYHDLSRAEIFHDGDEGESDNVIVFANIPGSEIRQAGFYTPKDNSGTANPLVVCDNSEYVFTMYQGETVVGEYTTVIKKGNESDEIYENPDAESKNFAIFFNPRQYDMDNPDSGLINTVRFEWSLPIHMYPLSLNYYLTFMDINETVESDYYIKQLDSSLNYDSKALNHQNIQNIDVYIRAVDSFDRIIDTFISKKYDVDEDIITQPLTLIEVNPVF